MQHDPTELLTLEQFAERLGISRSTAYSWLAEGHLVAGKHVVRIKRVIRVLWNTELLTHLLALSVLERQAKPPRLQRNGKGGRNRVALDSGYLDPH